MTPGNTLGYSIWFRYRKIRFNYHVTSSVIHPTLLFFIISDATADTQDDFGQTLVLGAS